MSRYWSKFIYINKSIEKVGFCFLAPISLFFFFIACHFFSDSVGDSTSLLNNFEGIFSTAHANDSVKPVQAPWHIRLAVEIPSVGIKDSMNSLGIDPKGSSRRDLLDIVDQPRPPWTEHYIDLVFPHPEWEGDLTDFSSDFHGTDSQKSKVESWLFEVRSNIFNEEVIFSWHGPAEILAHCRLRDGTSGQVLVSDPVNEGYAFTMSEPVRSFIWEYIYQ